jgi:hypothetical protein
MSNYQISFTLQSQFIGTQADNFTIIGRHINGSPSDTTIATNVTKAQLISGVTYTVVDTITGGTITSTGVCTNSINWLGLITGCNQYNLLNGEPSSGSEPITFNWTVCHSGDPGSINLYPQETYTICSTTKPIIINDPNNYGVIDYVGACPTTFNLNLDITEGMGQSIFGYFNIFVGKINQFGSFQTEYEYYMTNGETRVETIPYEPGDIIWVSAVAKVKDGVALSINVEGVDEETYLYNESQNSFESENFTPQISGEFIMPYHDVTIYMRTWGI